MLNTDLDDLNHLFNINVRGTYLVTREIVKRMIGSTIKNARILTVTSVNGVKSGAGFSLYGGSKAWLEMMMKNLALEVAPLGIRVNTFPVGAVKTDMTRFTWEDPEISRVVDAAIPLGRMGESREIAELICSFAGRAGDYVTGSSIVADGGLALTRSVGMLKNRINASA